MTKYLPGLYVKGNSAKKAETPADAVDLVWQGYTLSEATEPDPAVEPDETEEGGTPAEPVVEPAPPVNPPPFDPF